MAAPNLNFNPFSDNNWLKKPLNFLSVVESLNPFRPQGNTPNFAALSLNPFSRKPKDVPEEPGKYSQMLDRFDWECENLPDYRHTPEVERILNEDPILKKRWTEFPSSPVVEFLLQAEEIADKINELELKANSSPYRKEDKDLWKKKDNPTPEEIQEYEKRWTESPSCPLVQFLRRAEEIADKINEFELKENSSPYRKEDKDLWKAVPNVIGPDGRPMPRKAIKTRSESDDKFWDFARQFFFGLWGFRQRPYPPGRPIDVAQAIGYKKLEKRYYDFIMRSSGWWYKDRLGRTRGPMELIQLKTAWGAGMIDKHTFIWGEDMDEWAPIGMVYGLERAIATWEVRLGAAATAFIHKLQKGIPPWVPLKGHEDKTYKQMQEEAYASKRRDMAVLEANNGIWPGVKIPSHALFLWASGSELTSILEEDYMPNKYIPKDVRYELAKIIPGLRPWEVLSVEQAMDQITFGGKWYRQYLGSYKTGPPYIQEASSEALRVLKKLMRLGDIVGRKLEKKIPGLNIFAEKVRQGCLDESDENE